jgi:hypothetical protein
MGNHDPSLWTFPFFLVEARDGEFMAKIKRREIGDSKVGVNDHEGRKMYRALESVFFAFKALPGGQIRSVLVRFERLLFFFRKCKIHGVLSSCSQVEDFTFFGLSFL